MKGHSLNNGRWDSPQIQETPTYFSMGATEYISLAISVHPGIG